MSRTSLKNHLKLMVLLTGNSSISTSQKIETDVAGSMATDLRLRHATSRTFWCEHGYQKTKLVLVKIYNSVTVILKGWKRC